MTPRAVFDCMVFVQALASAQGPAWACYQLVRDGQLTLCVSPAVLAEIHEVLNRPKLQRKLPAVTPERVAAFLGDVTRHAVLMAEVPEPFRYGRDPKDEPYINLALAAGASYLVSRDQDLLDLRDDEDFRRCFPTLTILEPQTLLREFAPTRDVQVPEGGTETEGSAPSTELEQ